MKNLTEKIMYDAMLQKDTAFEGQFWVGVKTTGIFCRPTCTARKPKLENIEFFRSSKDALLKGYRPCKICDPMNYKKSVPEDISHVLEILKSNPNEKVKDSDLVNMNVEPSRIRRWFMKNHDMTFHAYQRMLRINNAFEKIRKGNRIIDAAFDSGYQSLSGFNDAYRKRAIKESLTLPRFLIGK